MFRSNRLEFFSKSKRKNWFEGQILRHRKLIFLLLWNRIDILVEMLRMTMKIWRRFYRWEITKSAISGIIDKSVIYSGLYYVKVGLSTNLNEEILFIISVMKKSLFIWYSSFDWIYRSCLEDDLKMSFILSWLSRPTFK